MSDQINPYQPPKSVLNDVYEGENTSGMGKNANVPAEAKGWCWGAFLWGWIWAIGNNTWIGLICLIPYIGFIMQIYLGVKGREMAWRNKRWDSVEHFNAVQRKWTQWWLILVGGIAGIGILAAIVIPMFAR
ncbi:hypothetical protein Q9Q94_07295 [Uliginosibacterium sp. 31-16]|uniref:hypothetical protein n=1 Tax=Uliginosibacterium sp. 31-16 TaxID=3068315 RepID=UPI00273F287A|nr:hypothetical protein [Uliginosibacterium sp. 31-16]MDP5239329.1 hypothetical protein [Uliginosibacterium sp. 31-16]